MFTTLFKAVALSAVLISVNTAVAQNYPTRPIRIVVPGTGGGGDFAARLIAQGLPAALGQQVIVDNRPVGTIPGEVVSRAAPDGYTLLLSASTLWLAPLLQPNVPYDAEKDFAPITLATMSPNILVVPQSLPVKSVKDLLALAKARPGELNYGSGAAGSSNHLSAELFKSMGKVSIVRINYKNPSQAVTDVISGQIQVLFYNASTVAPHIQSGKLRGLAVTSLKPTVLAPNFPTVSDSGLSGYEAVATFGVFAPAQTPGSIINMLNRELVRYLTKTDVKEKFVTAGSEVVGSTSQELAAILRNDILKIGKLVKESGLRAD